MIERQDYVNQINKRPWLDKIKKEVDIKRVGEQVTQK